MIRSKLFFVFLFILKVNNSVAQENPCYGISQPCVWFGPTVLYYSITIPELFSANCQIGVDFELWRCGYNENTQYQIRITRIRPAPGCICINEYI
ncbi:hypothetical protein D9V86_00065 [Bacteroidetes/Chlorobi group bacterium ChocPot_Mid]|jgi:hypothetical protein|nr:MAG: hypothetical protein D9V86_00065 [Bacteroidetes/Chlorobi group bacterium ChocPot_Mid]